MAHELAVWGLAAFAAYLTGMSAEGGIVMLILLGLYTVLRRC